MLEFKQRPGQLIRSAILVSAAVLAVGLLGWSLLTLVPRSQLVQLTTEVASIDKETDALRTRLRLLHLIEGNKPEFDEKLLELEAKRVELEARRFELEDKARATLAQALAASFFLITAYLTGRSVVASERTVRLGQESQITDRFTKGVELLGSDELSKRLGGIYALARTAKAHPEEVHWPIMQVLTGYVAEHSRWLRPAAARQPSRRARSPSSRSSSARPSANRPPVDIEAILTVLKNRTSTHEAESHHLELRDTDLRNASLQGITLKGAFLSRANLDGAQLYAADLRDATLDFAHLEGADLRKTKLQKAVLTGAYGGAHADATGTDFSEADLEEAHLKGAELSRANFTKARLVGASFNKAKLPGAILTEVDGATRKGVEVADFSEVYLEKADLRGANLGGAKFKKARLDNAHLERANLAGVDFEKATLIEVHADDADFTGATLTGASIRGAQLTKAKGLTLHQVQAAEDHESAHLPDYLAGAPKARTP